MVLGQRRARRRRAARDGLPRLVGGGERAGNGEGDRRRGQRARRPRRAADPPRRRGRRRRRRRDGACPAPTSPRALAASGARVDKEAATRAAFEQRRAGPRPLRAARPARPSSASSTCRVPSEWTPRPSRPADEAGEPTTTTGVRCTMMRGGTSKGVYFEARDLPADPAARDDLLLRLMGSPDPRQIDGLGGADAAHQQGGRRLALRSDPDVDVDYLFLQVGVDEADGDRPAELRQHPRRRRARSPSSAASSRPTDDETSVRIRMVNSDSVAVATFPTPGGRVDYRGDVGDRRCPRHGRPDRARRSPTRRARRPARCCRPGSVRDTVDGHRRHLRRQRHARRPGARRSRLGVTGYESHEQLAGRRGAADGVDAIRLQAAELMGMGDVSARLGAEDGAARRSRRRRRRSRTRSRSSRCSRTPRSACSGAVSVVTGMLLARRRRARARPPAWPGEQLAVDVEHPTGHLLVDVVVDDSVTPPRVRPLRRRPHRPQALRRHRLPALVSPLSRPPLDPEPTRRHLE